MFALLAFLRTIALSTANAPDCFLCSLPEPHLPPISSAPPGIDFTALQEVFNHSFGLSRTIYKPGNPFDREADYWFKEVRLPGQSNEDVLYQLVTGDITAMWVRDSVWQVIPYILSAKKDSASKRPCDPDKPSLKCLSRGVLLTLAFLVQQEMLTGVKPSNTTTKSARAFIPSGYFSVFKAADRTNQIRFNSMAPNAWPKPTFRVVKPTGVDLGDFNVPFGAVLQQHGYPNDPNKFKASNSAEGWLFNWTSDLVALNTSAGSYVNDIMYEPDSLSSLAKAIFLYNSEYPDDGLLNHRWVRKALESFVDIILTEINHDNSPYSVVTPLQRLGVPENWPRPVRTFSIEDEAVLTWVGFRPSDVPCTFNYNIPVNLYIATALDSISEMYSSESWAVTAQILAKKIVAGVRKYGVIFGKYAYEVDAMGNYFFADDANYPNLHSMPFLVKPTFFDMLIYQATANFIQTKCSETYCSEQVATQFCDAAHTQCLAPYYHSSQYCPEPQSGVVFEGFGSNTETTKYQARIWPMSITMHALVVVMTNDTPAFWADVMQLDSLYAVLKQSTQGSQTPSLPESFLACSPGQNPSRDNDSFGWMATTYFLLGRGWWTPQISPYADE